MLLSTVTSFPNTYSSLSIKFPSSKVQRVGGNSYLHKRLLQLLESYSSRPLTAFQKQLASVNVGPSSDQIVLTPEKISTLLTKYITLFESKGKKPSLKASDDEKKALGLLCTQLELALQHAEIQRHSNEQEFLIFLKGKVS